MTVRTPHADVNQPSDTMRGESTPAPAPHSQVTEKQSRRSPVTPDLLMAFLPPLRIETLLYPSVHGRGSSLEFLRNEP